jgi:AcrR family transcriptional regulator
MAAQAPDAPRALRRDAIENRERLIAGALCAIAREGISVPVLTIAREAGLGVATFYRCFNDRSALIEELEHRAYDRLIGILDDNRSRALQGLEAIQSYLTESLAIADELVLPLHGAVPLMGDVAAASRRRIDELLEDHLAEGRANGEVRDDVNATDIIVCSALITQRLRFGTSWEPAAQRHIALFVAGLGGGGVLPAPPIGQSETERALRGELDQHPDIG